jgi:putative FmdB family regulatory protein
MPLFDYKCSDCAHQQEHFVFAHDDDLVCSKCTSVSYYKQLSFSKVDVEYSNPKERYDKKIKPGVKDTYAKIGREALNDDTRTAENIFGKSKVQGALGD